MNKLATRYIFSMGELKRQDNSLILRTEIGHQYLPIEGLRELYLMNEISINTKLLSILAKCGITIHFFDYYQGFVGSFYPKEQLRSGKISIAQVKCFIERREKIAKAFVRGIAINIHELLYHYYRHGNKEIKPYLDWLKEEVPLFLTKPLNHSQLLFIEGDIWQRFYQTFKLVLNQEFSFEKRVKRPPDNPLNALISFGNSLLYTKTVSAIYQTHLDQSVSFLHEPAEKRFSLSLDLSEVFKPAIVYKVIFELINRRQLQVNKHFDKKLNYCLLNELGKKVFIQAFEEKLNATYTHPLLKRKVSYQHSIRLDGYKLIKEILGEKDFAPFSLKDNK